jgi:hypothetical protein
MAESVQSSQHGADSRFEGESMRELSIEERGQIDKARARARNTNIYLPFEHYGNRDSLIGRMQSVVGRVYVLITGEGVSRFYDRVRVGQL